MAENSKIQWTDHTLNPWIGCSKVSPGCQHCYAEELMANRYKKVQWGKGAQRQRTSAANWKQPVKWNRDADRQRNNRGEILTEIRRNRSEVFVRNSNKLEGYITIGGWNSLPNHRPRVFCASLADWLDDEVPIEWLADLLKLIHDTPNLDWLLLTKRPENWQGRLKLVESWCENDMPKYSEVWRWVRRWTITYLGDGPPANVWIGTTVENQEYADKRIPELLKIPAKVRFLSVEPMLGPVDLDLTKPMPIYGDQHEYYEVNRGIHWIICGAESGRGRREMKAEWALGVKAKCEEAGAKFFMKQMEVNGKISGNLSDFPPELQVREFPRQEEKGK